MRPVDHISKQEAASEQEVEPMGKTLKPTPKSAPPPECSVTSQEGPPIGSQVFSQHICLHSDHNW